MKKIQTAANDSNLGKKPSEIKSWLETEDAYTLCKPLCRRFPRNPYKINNIPDVWECDLIDVQALTKFNYSYIYVLTAIDVISKFLHIVHLKSKTGPAVTSSFQSFLKDSKYSPPLKKRPIWVWTDKFKKFLNRYCQDMLKHEGMLFQVCRNPDVKCSVIERAQRTIRNRLYKYFTYRNTHRYSDVLPQLFQAYNGSVHYTIDMAPSKVTDSDVG